MSLSAARTTVCAVSIIFCIYLAGLLLLLLLLPLLLHLSSFPSFFSALFFVRPRKRARGVRTDRKSDNHRPLCAWRLGEAEPFARKRFLLSYYLNRDTRINACSWHRRYLYRTRQSLSPSRLKDFNKHTCDKYYVSYI